MEASPEPPAGRQRDAGRGGACLGTGNDVAPGERGPGCTSIFSEPRPKKSASFRFAPAMAWGRLAALPLPAPGGAAQDNAWIAIVLLQTGL
jgi:hypothetical protein